MAQFQHSAGKSLCGALLSSALFITQLHADTSKAPKKVSVIVDTVPTKAITAQSVHTHNSLIQQKQQEALAQIDHIESIFDTIGQTLASGASNIPAQRKARTRSKLNLLRRDDIDKIKRFASVHVTPEQLYQLALFNSEVINILEKAVATDLKTIPTFDFAGIQKKYLATEKNITPEKISAVLQRNSLRLIKLDKESQKIGLSGINSVYRGVRKFNKDWSVTFWMEHAAVYSAFIAWWIYVTSDSKLSELPFCSSLTEKIREWKKSYIGSTPSQSQNGVEGNANIVEIKLNPKGEQVVLVQDQYDRIAPFLEIQYDKETHKFTGYKDISDKIDRDALWEKGAIISNGISSAGKIRSESPFTSNDHYPINTVQSAFAAIVAFDHKVPLISLSPGPLFANYIKNDAVKAYDKLKIYKNRLDDHFFGTSKKSSEEASTRTERFKDIVGREEVKAELNRVIEYICNPDRFDRAGIKVERGYLLAGEPQTGKTLMAKALAGEISAALERQGKNQKMRLFEISTENLAKKGIAYYMDLAKTFSPCILFLDELDLLRLQRDGDNKTLSEFLTTMSGSLNNNEKDQVIILAATNKPENLDFALRQHGRFGKMFWFDKPTFKHRVEFFIKECEKRCSNPDNFNIISLAQQTEGCSFGSLDIVFKKGLMHAKLENAPVSQLHFEKAIDFEIRKLIPSGYSIAPDKEEVIAARQAGKALVNILLAPAKTLCSVTILPITQELEEEHVTQQYNFGEMKKKDQRAVRYGNIFAYHLYDSLDIQTQEEMVKQCKILLASNAAQRVHGLTSCAFDKFDKQEAFNLARAIIFEGLDAKEMAKEIRNQKLTQAYRLLEQYEAEMEALLTEHKQDLALIIQALQKHKTLSVGQINELLAMPKVETSVAFA
jgi:cell division protease FtsH